MTVSISSAHENWRPAGAFAGAGADAAAFALNSPSDIFCPFFFFLSASAAASCGVGSILAGIP